MKRVITGTCLAAAFAVGLAAQTPPPQTPPSTPQNPPTSSPSAMQDRDSAKTVTVTGCLKAGDSADSYTLSDLKWGSKDKSAGGAVGTSGSAPAGIGAASTLKIVPSGSTKLSEHVGHQVELTCSVGDKDSARPSAKPSDPAAAPSAGASGPTFEAKSVKMVAATCSM